MWAAGKYLVGLPAPYLAGLQAASVVYIGAALLELAATEPLLKPLLRKGRGHR